MSHLLDEEGNIYEQGIGGKWNPSTGVFGQNKDTNLFGQPNIQRDFLGRPVEARVSNTGGRTLYKPSFSSSDYSPSSMGDALAGAAAIFIVILAFMALSALVAIFVKAIEELLDYWQYLHQRYPRQMLFLKLVSGMALTFSILYLEIQRSM